MRYGPGLLEEVLRRTDLVQLVGRRVKLTRKGHVFWGCCPFHKEKSPSFKVENERRTYKCFGCGAGGDVLKFVMEVDGLTFPETLKLLSERHGMFRLCAVNQRIEDLIVMTHTDALLHRDQDRETSLAALPELPEIPELET